MKRNFFQILIVASVICVLQIFTSCSNKDDLPVMPDVQYLTGGLKEQIIQANETVIKKWSADNLGYLGMVYYSSNYYDEAEKCFNLAAQKTRNDWRWDYYLAYLNIELGVSEKAAEHLNRVLEINPDETLAAYRLANVYRQMNKNEEAKILLNDLLGRRLSDFRLPTTGRSVYFQLPIYTRYLLARILSEENNYREAESEFKKIISKDKTFGPAYKQLGLLFSVQGDSLNGEKYTLRSNDLIQYVDPVDTLMDRLILMSKSDTYMLKHVDNAIYGFDSKWSYTILSAALTNLPGNKYVISKAVKQMTKMGLGKMVTSYLDIHFDNFENSWSEMQKTAIVLADAGFIEEAKRFFLQAKAVIPDNPENCSTLAGLMYEKAGMKDEAENWIMELLADYPEDFNVLNNGIFLLINLNELDQAKKYLKTIKRIDPESAKGYSLEGFIQLREGNTERAMKLFEQAYKGNAKNEFLVNQLGEYYQQKKQWGKAIDLYKNAIKEFPNKSDIQERLGALLIACPDKDLVDIPLGIEYAERSFYNYIYTLPIKVSAARMLAIGYSKSGNQSKAKFFMGQAIEWAQKAQLSPEYIQSLRNLSRQLGII